MKKLIIIIVLLPSLVFAFSIQEMHKKVIAARNAVSTTCAPWYADSGVVFSWNANHGDGVDVGCKNDGSAFQLSIQGGATVNSTNGIEITSTSAQDYLTSSPTSVSGILDNTVAQTYCAKVYVSEIPTARYNIIKATDGSDDVIILKMDQNNQRYLLSWDTQDDAAVTLYTATTQLGVWSTIAYSNGIPSTGILSGDPGDGAGYDDGGTIQDMTDNFTRFEIGNGSNTVPDGSKYCYIKQFAILNGEKSNCGALTGW